MSVFKRKPITVIKEVKAMKNRIIMGLLIE